MVLGLFASAGVPQLACDTKHLQQGDCCPRVGATKTGSAMPDKLGLWRSVALYLLPMSGCGRLLRGLLV